MKPQVMIKWELCIFLGVFLHPSPSGRGGRFGGSGASAEIGPDLIVQTKDGRIQGIRQKAANGRDVDMWWGIPFAEPPVGDLRFRAPKPVKSWTGVKIAHQRPNSCIQIRDTVYEGFSGAEMWNPNTKMDEDCLYLNIAVPVPHPGVKNNSAAAVMIWIYGGSFYSGTSTLDVYDPRTLASEQNVIVASMQYRVASLGFLYLGQEDIMGNQGLLDQRMAIKWIHDNIEAFGGNPKKITLFSESAGSASVAFHLLSPGSRSFYKQAILQSAGATNTWAMITKKEAKLRAQRLAELLKCPHSEEEVSYMASCLRQANATAMVNAEWDGIVFGIMGCPFTPVFDGVFFPDPPGKALQRKNFKKTSLLLGTNRNEGNYFILYYLTDIYKKEENLSISRDEFERAVKELNPFVSPVGLHAINYEYTWWMDPDNMTGIIEALDQMVGDYQFICPTLELAQRYSETQNNVYLYYFNERSSINPWPSWSGVLHADEIAYIFGQPLNDSYGYTEKDKHLSRTMMTFWANFAKTGHPSQYANGSWMSTYWPIHTPFNKEYLELRARNLTVGNGYRARKCAFWKNYLPNLLANEPAKECSISDCIEANRERSAENYEGSGNNGPCLNMKEDSSGNEAIGDSSSLSSSATAALVSVFIIIILAVLVAAAS